MTQGDSLQITYIGGPTALIEFGGLRLLTDPTFDPPGGEYTAGPVTLSKTAGPARSAESLGKIDAVLLSHDHHFDNLDHAGRVFLANAGRVLTTQDGAQRLGGNAVGLEIWKSADLPTYNGRTLRVTATPARHGPAGRDRGPVIGFLLQYIDTPEDVVYISGDTVWFEGVEQILQQFLVKTAILFMGAARVATVSPAHITFTAEEAIRLARKCPEATIVPLHFEGWKHFSESREDISRTFAEAGLADRLRWLDAGRPVNV
jgi:L-ascorbate metabolism protein UlaG (beta-lactamase superfamily)